MKFIDQLEGLVSSKAAVAKGIFTLLKLEARLAGLTIYPLLINLSLLVAILMTLWFTTMVLIGYLVVLFTGQTLAAIGLVLVLNVAFSAITIKSLMTRIRQMSFEKTRACLANHQREANEHKERTTELNCSNRNKSAKRAKETSAT